MPLRASPSTVTVRPAEEPGADAGRGEPVQIDERAGHRRPYLGIEATKSVTPSMPASAPTIQKRIVIFSSSQPPSSKW